MKNIFSLITLSLFISISSPSQETYSIAAIPLELTENSNSVLLDEKVEVDVSNYGKLYHSYYGVRAVLNKRGDKDVDKSVYYDNDSQVKKIEMYVYDAFGNEIEHFKKKFFVI